MAQCSAIGVSVADTPPCSAIRFRKEIFLRHLWHFQSDTPPPAPPISRLFSSLQNTPNTIATGAGKQVRHGLLGGVARHSCDTSKIAGICRDTVCATLCSAIGHVRAAKGDEGFQGSAAGFRGKFSLRCSPPRLCVWIAIGHFLRTEVGV